MDQVTRKKEELKIALIKAVGDLDPTVSPDDIEETVDALFHRSVSVSAPGPRRVLAHVSFSDPGLGRPAKSVKPGNIRLNIKAALTAAAAGALTIGSIASAPWLLPAAAILLWSHLMKTVEVELTKAESIVFWAMYVNANENHVGKDGLLDRANEEFLAAGLEPIKQERLEVSLERLVEIGTIQDSGDEWFLSEMIRINWS